MSPIGRMFIVLNLVLAAAFLGWASNALSTVQDYKGQLETEKSEHNDTAAAKDEEISKLRIKTQNLEGDSGRFREERDLEKSQRERSEADLAAAKRANEMLSSSLSKIESNLGDYKQLIEQFSSDKDNLAQLNAEATRAREDAVDAQQAAELQRRDAEAALREVRGQVDVLHATNTGLQSKLKRQEVQIAILIEETGLDPTLMASIPKIDASVLDVREVIDDLKLVMLNRGSNDGVKRGFTFDIYRGQTYKGRAKVETVQADYCSALITTAVESKTITAGDRASTRL